MTKHLNKHCHCFDKNVHLLGAWLASFMTMSTIPLKYIAVDEAVEYSYDK